MPRSLDGGNDVDVIEQVHYFCMLWCARPRREISPGASCGVACLKFSPTFTPWIRLILFSLAQMSEFCHQGVHQPPCYRPAPSANGRNIKNLHFPPLISNFAPKTEEQSVSNGKCRVSMQFRVDDVCVRIIRPMVLVDKALIENYQSTFIVRFKSWIMTLESQKSLAASWVRFNFATSALNHNALCSFGASSRTLHDQISAQRI